MTINQLIKKLEKLRDEHGKRLPVCCNAREMLDSCNGVLDHTRKETVMEEEITVDGPKCSEAKESYDGPCREHALSILDGTVTMLEQKAVGMRELHAALVKAELSPAAENELYSLIAKLAYGRS